ncbi:MAG: YqeG family HAD IIIA-type phosphatase [Firmicutes bacterium]|nr:YqeG family HAD IIIA-type phosphatase [Bacillota bacterium]
MGFSNLFRPDQYVRTVYEVDFDLLWEQGIRGLFFDVDNTLIPFYENKIPPEAVKLLTDLRRRGFKVFILSNGRAERVRLMEKQVRLHGFARSGKPLRYGIWVLNRKTRLKGRQMATIGDQVFMDVLCGHLGGGKGILIEPIDRVRDEASVMKRRAAETKMLHRLGIRQFCETDSDAQSAASQKNS